MVLFGAFGALIAALASPTVVELRASRSGRHSPIFVVMDKIAGVIDIAAITLEQEIGNCQIRIAMENRFKAGRFLVLVRA